VANKKRGFDPFASNGMKIVALAATWDCIGNIFIAAGRSDAPGIS
jgi:hypothetical protein